MIVALVATVGIIILGVTYTMFDPDFWQHLLVGKAIWQTHGVPDAQVWTWPTYGTPEITPSWGFRALIWPFWSLGGVWGLFAWRWFSTLAAFALLWSSARRMGSRGFVALGVLIVCVVAYRLRSQVRPETLVAILIALEIWLLETMRRGGRDLSPWLILVAWVWANAHLSYYLGFVILGAYLADATLRARRGAPAGRAGPRRLAWVMLGSAAISFVNPFGWRALWQPFDYFLHLRHEPMFRSIEELKPFPWRENLTNGLALLLVSWPLLVLWRLSQRTADAVDILLCSVFTTLAIVSQRFFGFFVLAGAPFVMRDLDGWLATRPWPAPPHAAWWKAAAIVVLALSVARGVYRHPVPRVAVAIDESCYPMRACDFMVEQGVRGRGFNQFFAGGYLLYRFWPDRDRLPFMDIHQAGGRDIRLAYLKATASREGWRELDQRFSFDYVVLDRRRHPTARLLDVLDADSTFAMVFLDDAAALYVRRAGPLGDVASRFAYRQLPAGIARLGSLGHAVADSAARREVVAELQREILDSPWHADALSLLANVALMEGRYADAREMLGRGLAIQPTLGLAHERLGGIELEEGHPREALREFEQERRLSEDARPGNAFLTGVAWRKLGEPARAREWYARELKVDPGSAAAIESLAALDRDAGR
jgi:tetratricopeptide (TPR) repeat protein